MGKITEEFATKYKEQIAEIEKELDKTSHNSSNLDEYPQITLEGAAKLVSTWELLEYSEKQRLQYIVFPSGMKYNRKNDEVRTDDVNPIFPEIARLTGNFRAKRKRTNQY